MFNVFNVLLQKLIKMHVCDLRSSTALISDQNPLVSKFIHEVDIEFATKLLKSLLAIRGVMN